VAKLPFPISPSMTKCPMAGSPVDLVRLDEDCRSAMASCEGWRRQEAGGKEEQPEGLRYAEDVGGFLDRHVYGRQLGQKRAGTVREATMGDCRERRLRAASCELLESFGREERAGARLSGAARWAAAGTR
jgi:hypothetical protein